MQIRLQGRKIYYNIIKFVRKGGSGCEYSTCSGFAEAVQG